MLLVVFSVCIGYGVLFLFRDAIGSVMLSTDRPWALQIIAILLLCVIPLVIGFVTFQKRIARFYQMRSTEFFQFRMKHGIHAIEAWIIRHHLTQKQVEQIILPSIKQEISKKEMYSIRSFLMKVIPALFVGLIGVILTHTLTIAILDEELLNQIGETSVYNLVFDLAVMVIVASLFVGGMVYKVVPEINVFSQVEKLKQLERLLYAYLLESEKERPSIYLPENAKDGGKSAYYYKKDIV